MIDDVAALVKPQRSFRAARLEVDVEGDLRVVLPGPRLTQILLNLVLNAVDLNSPEYYGYYGYSGYSYGNVDADSWETAAKSGTKGAVKP